MGIRDASVMTLSVLGAVVLAGAGFPQLPPITVDGFTSKEDGSLVIHITLIEGVFMQVRTGQIVIRPTGEFDASAGIALYLLRYDTGIIGLTLKAYPFLALPFVPYMLGARVVLRILEHAYGVDRRGLALLRAFDGQLDPEMETRLFAALQHEHSHRS